MHRFAFHAPPLAWPPLRRMQHRLHYDHHVEPNRLDLLFLPIWFLVPNLALAASLFALLFGTEAGLSALLGMMLAILHYEWVHYVAHIPYQPRTRLGRWIKQYHLRHHFISEKHWFGVSNPALDGVFGTFRGPTASEKAPRPAISIPEAGFLGQRAAAIASPVGWLLAICCVVLRSAESCNHRARASDVSPLLRTSDPSSALVSSFEAPASHGGSPVP